MSTKLKKLRIKSGLTQAQLADKLNVSASAIGMYEQGRREPDRETLSKICRTLDASGDYILDLETPEPAATTKAEVYSVISNFINNLENQEGLMFNGTPINKSEKEKIASALKIATAVTLSDINCDS
ncbi:MAG: helix-turn-helix transcriptional regulator [Clostridia bacterium]|nr:helix-turn-helix transcriptional regulator [Clostridia bacterium]